MRRREQSQTEQLRQALAEREAQLGEARARLAALEGSTSLQVGRALTAAAKRPGRGLVRLPRDLFRLWRSSGRTRQAAGRAKSAPVRAYGAERQEARLLAGTIGATDDRLIVAGVLAPEVRAAIEPYVRVIPLRAHDAQVVFESVDVDAVCVSGSAATPGSPWAYVGDPAAADRTRALHWVVEAARARGVPSILIADAPAPPALAALGFDLVHEGGVGVPLHRFNPVAAEPERDPEPAYIPSVRPPGPVASRVRDAVTGHGVRRADPFWRELPGVLRSESGVVVDDPDLARRALACGTRPLLLREGGRASGEPEAAEAAVRTVPATPASLRSGAAVQEVTALRAAGPLEPEEVRTVLRSLFLNDATPVVLAGILGEVDLAPGSGDASLPLRDRRVALLAVVTDDIASLSLADDVLAQSYPPAEVVVPEGAAGFTGLERLRSHGVTVRTAAGVGLDLTRQPDPATWSALAGAAESPWAALWRGPRGAAFLADALCAAECSGADAVGPAIASWRTEAPVDDTAVTDAIDQAVAGQEYVFVSAIQPDLARCALLRRGIPPGVWNRHGARLLALGPSHGADHRQSPDHAHTAPKGTT